jgi:hypothetical protein
MRYAPRHGSNALPHRRSLRFEGCIRRSDAGLPRTLLAFRALRGKRLSERGCVVRVDGPTAGQNPARRGAAGQPRPIHDFRDFCRLAGRAAGRGRTTACVCHRAGQRVVRERQNPRRTAALPGPHDHGAWPGIRTMADIETKVDRWIGLQVLRCAGGQVSGAWKHVHLSTCPPVPLPL